MLKETLNIRKLGALDDTGVVEISPLTVFIGNSASGKSTLMKTLVLMRYIFKRLSIKAYLQNSHIKDSVISFKFKDLLRDNMNVLVSAETYIHYSVAINGTVYSVTYSNGKLSYNATIPNGDLCFFKEVWVTESRSAIAPLSSQGLWLRMLIWDSILTRLTLSLIVPLMQSNILISVTSGWICLWSVGVITKRSLS